MSEPSLAALQAAHIDAKSRAPYGFLKEPLSASTHGYEPDPQGGAEGRFSELGERLRFGEWTDVEGMEADEDYRALKTIHDAARNTWRSVVSTIEKVQADKDPTLNNDGKLKILGRVVEPRLEELARTAERELAKVEDSLAQVADEMTKAQRQVDPVDLAVHADIRRYWKDNAAAPDIRQAKMNLLLSEATPDAGKSLDTLTLQALVTAPAYLSGLSDKQQDRAKALLAERMTPDLVRRTNALVRGRGVAAKAVQTLEGLVHRTIDMTRARSLREMAKDHG